MICAALVPLAALAISVSCSHNEPESSVPGSPISKIVCTMEDFEPDVSTKVTSKMTGKLISSTWDEGDVIAVFPSKGGDHVAFVVSDGAGTSNCVFDGQGWGLIANTTYSAFYPFHPNTHAPGAWKAVNVSYEGQAQSTKDVFNVGRFDYMACTNAAPVFAESPSGTCTFTFKHLGSLLVFDLTFPVAYALSTLSLECEGNVFTRAGTVDLSQEIAVITPTAKVNSLTLNLDSISVNANETIRLYMLTAPDTLVKPTLKVTTKSGAVMTKKYTSTYYLKAGGARSFSETMAEEEFIVVSQDNFSIKYPYNTITLDVACNKDYSINIPSGSDWVSVSDSDRYHPSFEVKINQTTKSRTATIVLQSAVSDLSKTVTITQGCLPSGKPVPVSHIMPCCRWNNNGTTFLVNNLWNSYHEYNDIYQCRDILKTIARAGIRVISIDFTNQAQWDSQWESDNFKGRLENIMQVCGEIGMEWFLFIGNLNLDPGISYWNGIAERIYNSYAQLGHYHKKDGKPLLLLFMPGTDYNSAISRASAANKTYLKNGDKFTIGTCQMNSAITPKTTDGWGYRNYSQSSDGAVRFVCPNSGVPPSDWARIDADAWSSRMDWGLLATRYIVVGSYDDTCDAIFWGIANVSASTTDCHKNAATVGDPYVYYNIVKNKLIGE